MLPDSRSALAYQFTLGKKPCFNDQVYLQNLLLSGGLLQGNTLISTGPRRTTEHLSPEKTLRKFSRPAL